jgi:hypothetical protein
VTHEGSPTKQPTARPLITRQRKTREQKGNRKSDASVVVVVYLTTLFQHLRLYSVDF